MLGGHLGLPADLGAVPKTGVYDNEGALVSRRGGKAHLHRALPALQRHARHGSIVLRQGPRTKGVVERANGYLETSFMPGRSFADPDDFNTQLADWLARGPTGGSTRPPVPAVERIDEDLAAMMALPPVLPDIDWHHDLRLPATTGCAIRPTTTRCTRRRSAAASTSGGDDRSHRHLRQRGRRPPRAGGPSTSPSPTRP